MKPVNCQHTEMTEGLRESKLAKNSSTSNKRLTKAMTKQAFKASQKQETLKFILIKKKECRRKGCIGLALAAL